MVEDPAAPCFDDDEAGRLVDGRMLPDERRVRVPHFDRCPSCYDRALDFFYHGWNDEDWTPSSRVDRYVLGEVLRGGHYWRMLQARDESTGRDVALRRLDLLLSEERYEDLARKQSTLMRLSHEHMASVSSLSIGLDYLCLTMELLEGRPLERWLTEAPRSWRAIVAALVPPLEAMLDAHRQGIVLLGFLPQNLVVRDDERGALANFGESHWSRSWIEAREGVGAGMFVEARALGPGREPCAVPGTSRERFLKQEAWEAATTLYHAFHGKRWHASPDEAPAWSVASPPKDIREMLIAVLDRAGQPSVPGGLDAMVQTLRRSLERSSEQ